MTAIHLKKDSFGELLKSDKPVFVDFWAPWCGPCKLAGPVVDELAKEYKDKAVVAKVNVDEEKDLAQQYGVMSIPTVVILKKGKEVERKIGFPGKEEYQAMLDKYVD